MPGSPSHVLHGLFKAVFVIGVLLAALLGLLVAWWLALLFALAWLLYSSVRRLLRGGSRNPAQPAAATVIEGEYRVEYNPPGEPDPKTQSGPAAAEPGGSRPRD